jgi:uncharacterized protein
VFWYRKSAGQGYVGGETNLAFMYSVGRGIPADAKQAIKLYGKAAKSGFAPAEFELGQLYFHGTGVPQKLADAIHWFRKAAEHGSAEAQNQLGFAYSHARGVQLDYAQAERWYRLAAANGSPEAQHNLPILVALMDGNPNTGYTVEAEAARAVRSQTPIAITTEDDLPIGRLSLFGRKR